MEAVSSPNIENSGSYALSLRKRLLDISGAIIGLGLSLPGIALAAVAIKLEDGGPIFYTHEQVGLNGTPFKMHKLRSMREVELDPFQEASPFKSKYDRRITAVGKWMRKASLDETPQFWNVLKGDMSLVGPRPNSPERHREIALIAGHDPNNYISCLTTVKPGLTGPEQVNGRGELQQSTAGIKARAEMELAYAKQNSLSGDARILLKTVGVVLSGRGAF